MAEGLLKPTRFDQAVRTVEKLKPVAANLNSAQWGQVPLALRERAFFSATVESARFLSDMQSFLEEHLKAATETLPNGEVAYKSTGRADFVNQFQEKALSMGLGTFPARGIQNVASEGRLKLIYDVNMQSAQDFARYKAGMDQAVLDVFPAWRFIRAHGVRDPRPRHVAASGEVRLKSDTAFWKYQNGQDIGGFGVPWGPWGFNSGMDVEDVDRDEAEALGLLRADELPAPVDVTDFNTELEASAAGMSPDILAQLKKAFGDQATVSGDRIQWRGQRANAVRKGRPGSAADLVDEPAPAPEPEPPPAPPPPPPKEWPDDPNQDVRVVRQLGGSTGAQLVEFEGKLYVRKRGNSADHIREECATDRVYQAAGLDVPEFRLYETKDGPVKLAKFVEGDTLSSWLQKATPAQRDAMFAKIQEGFAVDALTGNVDVVGTGKDNILIGKDGKPWRIDNGSGLRYRAQGALKDGRTPGQMATSAEWHEYPTELWTLRGVGFAKTDASEVFGSLPFDKVVAQLQALEAKRAAMIEAAPDAVRAVLSARFDQAANVAARASDFFKYSFKVTYADEHLRHVIGLRRWGVSELLPKKLTPGTNDPTLAFDENGKLWDDLRTSHAKAAAATFGANFTDPHFDPIVAAAKTLNKIAAGQPMKPHYKQALDNVAATFAKLDTADGQTQAHYAKAKEQILKGIAAVESGAKPNPVAVVTAAPPPKQAPAAPPPTPKLPPGKSIVAVVDEYAVANGASWDAVEYWQDGHASSSRNASAMRFQRWLMEQRTVAPAGYYSGEYLAAVSMTWNEKARAGLTIHHAVVQEVLGAVEFAYNDRDRRLVRLVRTEDKAALKENKIKSAGEYTIKRRPNDSHSIFRAVFVEGYERTVQAVPHPLVTGVYFLERRPGFGSGSFLGDGENEFTACTNGLRIKYVGNVDFVFDAASHDASTWGVPLP